MCMLKLSARGLGVNTKHTIMVTNDELGSEFAQAARLLRPGTTFLNSFVAVRHGTRTQSHAFSELDGFVFVYD